VLRPFHELVWRSLQNLVEIGIFPLDNRSTTPTQTLFQTYILEHLTEDVTKPWVTISSHNPSPEVSSNPFIAIYTVGSKIDNPKNEQWGTGAICRIQLHKDKLSGNKLTHHTKQY